MYICVCEHVCVWMQRPVQDLWRHLPRLASFHTLFWGSQNPLSVTISPCWLALSSREPPFSSAQTFRSQTHIVMTSIGPWELNSGKALYQMRHLPEFLYPFFVWHFCSFVFLFCFEIESHAVKAGLKITVVEGGFEFLIFLPLPPKCLDSEHVPACLAWLVLLICYWDIIDTGKT